MHECPACKSTDQPRHVHEQAHGLPGTHMAGTEGFVCPKCGHHYSRPDAEARGLVYVLDK